LTLLGFDKDLNWVIAWGTVSTNFSRLFSVYFEGFVVVFKTYLNADMALTILSAPSI
jgi:hypothetical protein